MANTEKPSRKQFCFSSSLDEEGGELKRDGDVAKAIQCGGDMKGQSLIEYYTHTQLLIHQFEGTTN